MPALDYAQPPPCHCRRRYWLIGLVSVLALSITTGGLLLAPIYRKQQAERRSAKIAALMQKSQGQIRIRDYEKALVTLDEMLAIDPMSDYARGAKPLVYDSYQIQQQRQTKGDPNWRYSEDFGFRE